MKNKLVVIINSLKVPKIKKILLYEKKFLVPNYSCLQNPWLGAAIPRSPFSLSSILNWICWTLPPQNKIPGYTTVVYWNNYCKTMKYLSCHLLEYRALARAIRCFCPGDSPVSSICVSSWWGSLPMSSLSTQLWTAL